MDALLKENHTGQFFKQINQMCKLKPSSPLVEGLELQNGEVTNNKAVIEELIARDLGTRQVLQGVSIQSPEVAWSQVASEIFTAADIDSAIQNTNFDIAIGPDGFDGKLILRSAELRSKVCSEIASAVNQG